MNNDVNEPRSKTIKLDESYPEENSIQEANQQIELLSPEEPLDQLIEQE